MTVAVQRRAIHMILLPSAACVRAEREGEGAAGPLYRRPADSPPASSSPSPSPRLRDFRVEVDPAYLSDPGDLVALRAGWDAAGAVLGERHPRDGWEVLPGFLYRRLAGLMPRGGGGDRGWFERYAADFACPYYHWCGTCAMGGSDTAAERGGGGTEDDVGRGEGRTGSDDPTSVLDDRLRVRGIRGLRVCDASAFPRCPSVPTALMCAGFGCAAAVVIAEDLLMRQDDGVR